MIEDWEILACAKHVMRQYGEAAWFHAAQRADDLLEANDPEGHFTWLLILARIEDLDKLSPEGGVH